MFLELPGSILPKVTIQTDQITSIGSNVTDSTKSWVIVNKNDVVELDLSYEDLLARLGRIHDIKRIGQD
jgi:hypothetical protein